MTAVAQAQANSGPASSPVPRNVPRTTADVLWEERETLRPGCIQGLGESYYQQTACELRLSALCLSGGGIRSAAFALGVVQALAAKGVLTSFDYLSTVSGGGYLGGFLQRWIVGEKGDRPDESGVEASLRDSLNGSEAAQITRLREGANFITPRIGSMSVDTWTAVATSVRNLIVNWTLFLPLFLLVAASPQLAYWLLAARPSSGALAGLLLEFFGLVVAMTTVGRALPSYRDGSRPGVDWIRAGILWPVISASAGVVLVAAAPALPGWEDENRLQPVVVIFLAATLAAFAASLIWSYFSKCVRRPQLIKDMLRWFICSVAVAAVMYLAAEAVGARFAYRDREVLNLKWLVALGPLALIGMILLAGWLFSATRSLGLDTKYFKPDLDREWLVRMSAILLKPAIIWLLLALLTVVFYFWLAGLILVAPGQLLFKSPADLGWGAAFASGGVLSGLVAALAGKSGATVMGYVRKWFSLELLIAVAVVLFIITGLLACAFLESWLAFHASAAVCDLRYARCPEAFTPWLAFAGHALVAIALGTWVLALGKVIDVNLFSLNYFYRNRLVKAFLGAARCDKRSPDPLTGFDSRDNVRMHSLWPAGRRCLFPVINLALNVSARARLAWQERKAEPFVVTPLACGSGSLQVDEDNRPIGAYVPASQYGGLKPERGQEGTGITLGAAMAISGAAVSPNMGYHSSPSAAFLMTLFNLRLGAWLPNPVKWRAQGQRDDIARKKNALIPFLSELTGSTGDDTDEVYLSDGGHFENLGLYEMIRRRCRFIFVSDGGCDPDFQFADLGNALRKISIDLRTDIVFRDVRLGARSTPVQGRLAYAVATIKYPEGWEGTLLYLKPSVLEDLPMDVNAYAIANLAFPHESTSDQWYSESQFESYRRLGQFLTGRLGAEALSRPIGPDRMEEFFGSVTLPERQDVKLAAKFGKWLSSLAAAVGPGPRAPAEQG
ncbi:MAG TPA: hypothetical protein VFQ67_06185 [Allosphingosinicella sp.]|jgi:hypothetical protein|nr:hypothetical protein [Allosphingosinicella sp.]